MTECNHPECAERDDERIGQAAAAQVLGDPDLRRICEKERPGRKPDYRSERNSVEVKQLASTSLKNLRTQTERTDEGWAIPGLKNLWLVAPDMTAAAHTVTGTVWIPNVSAVAEALAPMLLELERLEITDIRQLHNIEIQRLFTSSSHDTADESQPAESLSVRIANVIGRNSMCQVVAEGREGSGGISFGHFWGHGRSIDDLNASVKQPIQAWIDTAGAKKMQGKFESEDSTLTRCGVLIVDPSDTAHGQGIWRALTRDFPDLDVVPSEPLALPDDLDVLIAVVAEGQAISFSRTGGWERFKLGGLD